VGAWFRLSTLGIQFADVVWKVVVRNDNILRANQEERAET
jgi:hypothetical protein